MRNLIAFLAKYNNWLIALALEVLSLVLLFRYNNYQGSAWFWTANSVAGGVFRAEASVIQFFSLIETNEKLSERNYILERELGALRAKDATIPTNFPKEGIVAAKVVSNSVSMAGNLITIDKGSDDGIKRDMGVASGTGVVGVVCLVGKHYSIVMPLLNTRSRISCSIRGTGYFGYARWETGDPLTAWLEDIPRHAQFNLGDTVETSGYSSIFPQGIEVGRITEITDSPDGLSYRLRVALSTDFGRLRDVCVITDEDLAERAGLMEEARQSLGGEVR